MYKIITANGVEFRNPEGSFTLSKNNTVNEYEAEDGHTTIEIVRQNVISADVSYSGLIDSELKTMSEALTTVTQFVLYDPMTNSRKTISARVSDLSVSKVFYRSDVSVWSLKFKIAEL